MGVGFPPPWQNAAALVALGVFQRLILPEEDIGIVLLAGGLVLGLIIAIHAFVTAGDERE